MKRVLLLCMTLLGGFAAQAQHPYVDINQINYVSPTDLANCNDTSAYFGDTVRTWGVVVTPGNVSEVPSGSVQGGHRPFLFIADTANGGNSGPWKGIEVMGAYQNAQGNLLPLPNIETALPGDIIEFIGVVNAYNNGTQLEPIDGNSFSIMGSTTAPTYATVPLGDLNDANQVNIPTSGEQWENSFVELQNVTVTSVIYFSGNSRVSFNVVDGNGNTINVSDRFLAQKLPSHQTVNPYSPQATGSFNPPVPGTFYTSLKGMVRHDANGCFVNSGTRGYELNPFDASHYVVGYAPPYISNFDRDPAIPTSNQTVDLTMNISDFDGTVDTAIVYYTSDSTLDASQFPGYALNLVSGTTDEFEFTLPKYADGTLVRYYIKATDDQGNDSYYPTTPVGASEPNFEYYFVRDGGLKIFDIQFSLDGSGNSPLVGQTVTFIGIVTASTKQHDLGYLYVQDEGGTEWSGVWCVGAGITNYFREEEVLVTGQVQESFGMTQVVVSNIQHTGNRAVIQPVVIDPTDSTAKANFGWEKYESVLVEYRMPNNAKLYINNENQGFGDYNVSDVVGNSDARSGRILAGRQSSSSQSSLYVQLVTDSSYATVDGEMEVGPIEVSDTMSMDAVRGILFYGFSNYRLLPRNNDDFIGLNVTLDTTNLPQSTISVEEWNSTAQVVAYPNPATDRMTIELEGGNITGVSLYDLSGRAVLNHTATEARVELNLSGLRAGAYILRVNDSKGNVHTARVIISQ
ncbi:T9SS type A sorting domain-containing protein [Phaeocystidibacter marisrubri]|uniref:T9SS type A sorting domain-containing protein n=1 Tax=Phaeocystidibacter marisrubri TaxID=1577780 RepID=A0A6L3ZCA4_9FLAO|nr:T9SS type A sorting domain-containing protein [Phaeocystidibacter marisrubri]KAB2815294.1 T9SS type A sorting domain-containing protein [Phaeocystidibacter marisrubri]